jgi:hypothetical protein
MQLKHGVARTQIMRRWKRDDYSASVALLSQVSHSAKHNPFRFTKCRGHRRCKFGDQGFGRVWYRVSEGR